MPAPQIAVVHQGRLGNRMFQAMLALEIKRRVPDARITGLVLPDWNLNLPAATNHGRVMVLKGHRFNLEEAVWMLRSGGANTLSIRGWGMRLNYFGPPSVYRGLFSPRVEGRVIDDDELLIHIRAEDILSGWHPKYYPLPFSYYEHLIETTELKPVFIGQLEDNDFSSGLRRRFPGARFLPISPRLQDFETLRNAKNIALSISSFSWLATWLSEQAETIHLPIAGLFDPRTANTLLLPVNDARYRFYDVSFPTAEERSETTLGEWLTQPHQTLEIDRQQAATRVARALSGQPSARVTAQPEAIEE